MRERSVTDVVAGYLATISIFVGGLALVYRPARVAPAAIVVALIAVALAGPRSEKLTRWAIYLCALWWVGGMTAAVVTENPLW